jgi:hypothetical protein
MLAILPLNLFSGRQEAKDEDEAIVAIGVRSRGIGSDGL